MVLSRRAFSLAATAVAAPLARGREARAADTADVIVIGAGLSGLNAAWILTEAGYDVRVLEGASRLGGRVWSASEVENKPELGASQVGPSYARVLDAIGRLGLDTVEEDRSVLPFAYHIDGQLIRGQDWADHAANKTVGAERKMAPLQVAGGLLAKLNPMKELDDWLSPALAKYDVPIGPLLREAGASAAALRLAALTQDLEHASALGMMQEAFRGAYEARFAQASPPPLREGQGKDERAHVETGARVEKWPKNIVGGTEALPRAMAGKLNRPVLTGKRVAAIDMDNSGVDVRCADGTRMRARFAISAVPFATLRDVVISPAPDAVHARAIGELGYVETTRAFGVIKQPFWQEDGLDPSLFTDTALRMLWVIDNHKNGQGPHRCMFVMTWSAAEDMARRTPAEATAFLIAELERIRPAARGQVEIHKFHSWNQQPLQRGCRHVFRPGQINAFGTDMILPLARLHFAGEHTRRLDYGMEAAMESGERVAQEVLARL